MRPDDPRHGTVAGHVEHTRSKTPHCEPCRTAKRRYEKTRVHLGLTVVPTLGPLRRIHALRALGWSLPAIAAEAGWPTHQPLNNLEKRNNCTRATAQRIADAYDRLSMRIPTGTQVNRVRNHAARMGWAPPLAWAEGTIDDPKATPRSWKRAAA